MDETGFGVICNMDGGFGPTFDHNMKIGEPFRDRIIQFARLDFNGINRAGLVGEDRRGARARFSRPARPA